MKARWHVAILCGANLVGVLVYLSDHRDRTGGGRPDRLGERSLVQVRADGPGDALPDSEDSPFCLQVPALNPDERIRERIV